MVSPAKNNEITKWRSQNICGTLHTTEFDDLQLVDIEEYLDSIDKDLSLIHI